MKEIYIVVGWTGLYGDFQQWIVVAYTDKSYAIDHAKKAESFMANVRYGDKFDNPYDPDASQDYNGTRYFVETVSVYSKPVEELTWW